METTRRSFLKLLAIAGASAASPTILKLVSEDNEQLVLGMARELVQYDLSFDRYLVRIDIKAGDLQLGVDGMVDNLDQMDRVREPALALLQAEMDARGIKVSDLEPLPMPPGYNGAFTPTWTGFSG